MRACTYLVCVCVCLQVCVCTVMMPLIYLRSECANCFVLFFAFCFYFCNFCCFFVFFFCKFPFVLGELKQFSEQLYATTCTLWSNNRPPRWLVALTLVYLLLSGKAAQLFIFFFLLHQHKIACSYPLLCLSFNFLRFLLLLFLFCCLSCDCFVLIFMVN